MSPTIPVATGIVLAIAVIAAAMLRAQRRREARDEQSFADAVAQNLHLPVSLHPVIDPKACIGCLACLQACPEGDILGVVDGKAQLITAGGVASKSHPASLLGYGRQCEVAYDATIAAKRLHLGFLWLSLVAENPGGPFIAAQSSRPPRACHRPRSFVGDRTRYARVG